jgi:hypothetical protein
MLWPSASRQPKTYTLDGDASKLEPLAGVMSKVQGDLDGTTVKVTTAEKH